MRCKIATIDQMGAAVGSLMQYAELSAKMDEESSYYLKVVLSELITNSFKYGGGAASNQVRVEVSVNGSDVVVTVDDGGRGMESTKLSQCADIYSEGGRGLAIVKGLCQSVELNSEGNRVTARLALQ